MIKNKKVVLVGAGAVGTSFLYSCINQGLAQEYVIIDIFKDAAEGNALDLEDTNAMLEEPFVSIKAGEYSDCKDADIVVVTAGRPQKPGETRLDMVADNARIMKQIALEIKNSGFSGITIIASNPVDILTLIYQKVTEFNPHKVIGSGTNLDSARLRRLVAEKIGVSPKSVDAYMIGEHGDSSVSVWSAASIFGKPIKKYVEEKVLTEADLQQFHEQAWKMAYKIIEKKRATFYGIGIALAKIVKTILRGEKSILVIGAYLDGEYNQKDIYTGVPALISEKGWEQIIEWSLTSEEQNKLNLSCDALKYCLKVALEAIQ